MSSLFCGNGFVASNGLQVNVVGRDCRPHRCHHYACLPSADCIVICGSMGFWTAGLHPLAGEGLWQLVERAYNFGVPLTLLYVCGWGHGAWSWLAERVRVFLTRDKATRLIWMLRGIIAAYLIGHGALGVFEHAPNWYNYFGVLGINSATVSNLSLITAVGIFEIVLGAAVFLKPNFYLLWFVFAWKVFTEFLRIPAGELCV